MCILQAVFRQHKMSQVLTPQKEDNILSVDICDKCASCKQCLDNIPATLKYFQNLDDVFADSTPTGQISVNLGLALGIASVSLVLLQVKCHVCPFFTKVKCHMCALFTKVKHQVCSWFTKVKCHARVHSVKCHVCSFFTKVKCHMCVHSVKYHIRCVFT